VGDRFSELARRLKDRYEANVAFGEDEREKVNDALRQLGEALDAGFTAIGDSFRDPGMRQELKGAGSAIGDALTTTFNEVAEEIRKAVRR
jgi:Flp pilus assembly pilin Flp